MRLLLVSLLPLLFGLGFSAAFVLLGLTLFGEVAAAGPAGPTPGFPTATPPEPRLAVARL